MSQSTRLKTQLENVREMSEGFLQAFETPEQWTHQVDPNANHALWFAGHMGVADNFFISVVDPDKGREADGYSEVFGMGSQPTNDADAYPPVDEVLAYMRDRRGELLNVLSSMSDADLSRSIPEGGPDMFTDLASVFETAIWHEALHAGQVSVARRSLGHEPLFGSPKAEAEA